MKLPASFKSWHMFTVFASIPMLVFAAIVFSMSLTMGAWFMAAIVGVAILILAYNVKALLTTRREAKRKGIW